MKGTRKSGGTMEMFHILIVTRLHAFAKIHRTVL